jgi:hypothetical protein
MPEVVPLHISRTIEPGVSWDHKLTKELDGELVPPAIDGVDWDDAVVNISFSNAAITGTSKVSQIVYGADAIVPAKTVQQILEQEYGWEVVVENDAVFVDAACIPNCTMEPAAFDARDIRHLMGYNAAEGSNVKPPSTPYVAIVDSGIDINTLNSIGLSRRVLKDWAVDPASASLAGVVGDRVPHNDHGTRVAAAALLANPYTMLLDVPAVNRNGIWVGVRVIRALSAIRAFARSQQLKAVTVNLSLQHKSDDRISPIFDYNINQAVTLATNDGIPVVIAAGNCTYECLKASGCQRCNITTIRGINQCRDAIVVGAVDGSYRRMPYSAHAVNGEKPDVYAFSHYKSELKRRSVELGYFKKLIKSFVLPVDWGSSMSAPLVASSISYLIAMGWAFDKQKLLNESTVVGSACGNSPGKTTLKVVDGIAVGRLVK